MVSMLRMRRLSWLTTMANPRKFLCLNTLWLAPPFSVIAFSRELSHQSHVLENRDTYGQAEVSSGGHLGSSRAHGKQKGFGPAAATRHSQSARAPIEYGFSQHHPFSPQLYFPSFSSFLESRLNPNFGRQII